MPAAEHKPAGPPAAAAAVFSALLAALQRAGDPARAAQKAAYFKHVLPFLGVASPRVAAEVKAHVLSARLPAPALLEVARACLAHSHHELKQAGVVALHASRRALLAPPAAAAPALAALVGAAFDLGHVRDWATSDGLSSRVLAPLVRARPSLGLPLLEAWSRDAARPWKQRAAAVAFVPLARDAGAPHAAPALRVCAEVARAQSRFPQLGVGWCVRELSAQRPAEAFAFLRARLPLLSSEALRYALEKAPAAERAALLAEHKAARAAAGGGGSGARARARGGKRGREGEEGEKEKEEEEQ